MTSLQAMTAFQVFTTRRFVIITGKVRQSANQHYRPSSQDVPVTLVFFSPASSWRMSDREKEIVPSYSHRCIIYRNFFLCNREMIRNEQMETKIERLCRTLFIFFKLLTIQSQRGDIWMEIRYFQTAVPVSFAANSTLAQRVRGRPIVSAMLQYFKLEHWVQLFHLRQIQQFVQKTVIRSAIRERRPSCAVIDYS